MARTCCLLLAALAPCGSAVVPADAAAATVAATPLAHEVVSEVPVPVAISGVADAPSTLTVGWADLEKGCYSPLFADEVLSRFPVLGPFAMQQLGLVDEPGPHLLCAFLEDKNHKTTAASVAPLTARPPRSDYLVSAPQVVALGRPVRVRVTGGSEAPRSVFGRLAAPGTGCAAALSSGSIFMDLRSDVTLVDETEEVRLGQYGLWRACVRTERYWAGLDPTDAVSEAPIRVTVRCTAASRGLSRARDRWRAMSRRLRLRGLPPSPHLRMRGRAVRSARAWVAEACAPGA